MQERGGVSRKHPNSAKSNWVDKIPFAKWRRLEGKQIGKLVTCSFFSTLILAYQ